MKQYKKELGKVSVSAEGQWNIDNAYERISMVFDEHTEQAFISKCDVPSGIDLYNREYWMPLNVSGYSDSNIIILNKKINDSKIKSYSLEEAIKSIKPVGRKPGCILVFYNSNSERLDIGGCWEIWQFNDTNIYNWENIKSWQNIYYNYNKFVGWYSNEEHLKKYNPFPEVGCYAYVGSELNNSVVFRCDSKYIWTRTKETAKDYVKVILDGTITIGENGNWYQNGKDTNIPASVKGDDGKTPFIRNINNILEYSYDEIEWKPISEQIAAWFRWKAGDADKHHIGNIQISRDNITWQNLSGDIVSSLHISKHIGINEQLPTNVAEGTIIAKRTSSTNTTSYELFVYAYNESNTLAWISHGIFTSISVGLTQETGNNANVVMSQKAVTENLNIVNDNTGISEYPTFDPAKAYAIGDIVLYEGRLYRFTADHAAGEWIGTDVFSENLDLMRIKIPQVGTLNEEPYIYKYKVLTFGGNYIGRLAHNNNYHTCLFMIPFSATSIKVSVIGLSHIFFYNSVDVGEHSFISQYYNPNAESFIYIPNGARVVGINLKADTYDGSRVVVEWGNVLNNKELEEAISAEVTRAQDVESELNLLTYKTSDSINNEVLLIKNKAWQFGGSNLGGLYNSSVYHAGLCLIPEGAINAKASNEAVSHMFFYNSPEPSADTYITHITGQAGSIPSGARAMCFNVLIESYNDEPIYIDWEGVYNGKEVYMELEKLSANILSDKSPAYILKNHVCAWGGSTVGRVHYNTDYDVVIRPIKKEERFLKINESPAANVGNLFFFSNKPIIDEYDDDYHYLTHTTVLKDSFFKIPDGACYAVYNLDASETREPVYVESRDEMLDIVGYLSNNKSQAYILKNHVCSWGGTKVGKIWNNNSYDVAIIAVEEDKTKVKYSGSACTHLFSYSDYPVIDMDMDGYNLISQQGAGTLNPDTYYNIPNGAKFIAFNIAKVSEKESNITISLDGEEQTTVVDFKSLAKTVVANSVGIFDAVKTKFEDVYVNLVGDSQFAFLNINKSDALGVAAVPPTCDRTANANRLWNAIKWGDAKYRRFDFGKASLLAGYDDSFTDDSEAVFVETGNFNTEYLGAKMRETFPTNDGKSQVSTLCNIGSFPYQFDNSEDNWWQRNIPKRFSNTANASIQFTIPAGYAKFDFIYHAHIYGDVVTVTTNRQDGVVKCNSKQNDWDNAVEANRSIHDLSMKEKIYSTWGNDTFGIPNMRLHFRIEDTSVDTVVTITKSNDVSKYLIYWGMTYWGTEALPYALHISNMAIGGYSFYNAWMLVHSLVRFIPTDVIIMEMFANTVSSQPFMSQAKNVETYLGYFKDYFANQINISIDKVGLWLPHNRVTAYQNYPEEVKCTMRYAERIAKELGFNVIANARKLCDDINTAYYPDLDGANFMKLLGGDGAHLGDNGHKVYSAMWESLR